MKRHWPLVLVCLVNASVLLPELIETPDLNDNVLHRTLINGMVNAVEHWQNPFDFWSPEIGLGQPIVKLYQPGAHAIVTGVYFALFKLVSVATVFTWIRFLSLALMPLTFFFAARLIGLPCGAQIAAALLAPLVSGDSFGIDYGSYVWRGHGLFPQAVATHFLLLTMGFGWQSLRSGEPQRWLLTALLLGITGWCNLLFGYVGSVTLCIIALIPEPKWKRWRFRQLGKIAVVAGLCAFPKLLAWIEMPNAQLRESGGRAFMGDSFGAATVLRNLISGETLDHGRFPVLTILFGIGILFALQSVTGKPQFRYVTKYFATSCAFLIMGLVIWILLYFGRPFWGLTSNVLGMVPSMPLHRLIAPVQIFSVFLGAIALGQIWEISNHSGYALAAIGLLLSPAIQERREYLALNSDWRKETREAFAREQKDIDTVIQIARARGGRVYAGMPNTWGKDFKVGHVPVYSLFPVAGLPSVGYLYIAFLPRNVEMYSFNEQQPADYKRMDVRTVIAPYDRPALLGTLALAHPGRFVVYGVR